MADYCLPKKYASVFLKALKDGTINPAGLMQMSSAERRALFNGVIGEENAAEVNALFESKMLLKDQQRGLVTWAKQVAGISEPTRKDLLAKIQKLDRVLQPADEASFLADLAAKKLGVAVTADEAKEIFDLSRKVEAAKTAMRASPGDEEAQVQYGLAYLDMVERIDQMKTQGASLWDKAVSVLNIPRTIQSSIDLSAPFNQGWGMVSTGRFWEAFAQQFKYLTSEQSYRRLNAAILGHPNYELAQRAGLGLTRLGDKLSMREEAIQSDLVEKANEWLKQKTGIPNLIRASNRAYTGFLNYTRFYRFSDLVEAARINGEDVSLGSQVVHDLAKVVNDFTGRGALGTGDKYGSLSPVLNTVFYSPRKLSATIQMFNPWNFLNPAISPTARQAALRQLTGSILATGAVLGLARAMGASVDVDPRSTNFLKIGIGDIKLDVTGGNAIYLRLLARLATNQEVTSKEKLITLGEGYRSTTRADLALNFLRGKLAPVAATLADALYGKDPVGRPFSVTSEMHDRLIPMTIGSFIDFAVNDPGNTAAILPSLLSIFGVGLQTPMPPIPGRERDVWGEKISSAQPPAENDPVNQTLARIGVEPHYPARAIRGIKLSDAQYDMYVQYAGRLAKARLSQVVKQPGFASLPVGRQEDLVRKTINDQREAAANIMMMKNPEIIGQATQLKRERLTTGSPAAVKSRAGNMALPEVRQ